MSDKSFSWMITLSLHLFLIALSIFLKYSIPPQKPYDPIVIINLQQPVYTRPPVSKQVKYGLKNQPVPEKVELPKSIFNTPLDKISLPENKIVTKNRVTLENNIGNSFENLPANISKNSFQAISTQKSFAMDDDFIREFTNRITTEKVNYDFLLEGEILRRVILNKTIPKYPKGLQNNSTVKLQFEVNPKGEIENIIIIKKSDPELEKASIDAFTKWRFNPILSQENQKGYITFIYELQ